MSLIHRPFLYTDFSDPQDLESLPDDFEERPSEAGTPQEEHDANVIEEHEGIHYINREILNPNPQTEKDLNPDFKNLVNSVIKRN
jgi:hypothetical protein